MVKICASHHCLSNSVAQPDLNWFPLPKQSFTRDQWIELLGIKNSAINSLTRICSEHFKPKDFLIGNRKLLKVDVLPSLHLKRVSKLREVEISDDDDAEGDDDDDDDDDDDVKIISPEKQEPTVQNVDLTPSSDSRPSRLAARVAAEKIHNTVRKYCLNENTADDDDDIVEHPIKKTEQQRKIELRKSEVLAQKMELEQRNADYERKADLLQKAELAKKLFSISKPKPKPKPSPKPTISTSKHSVEIIATIRKPLENIPFNLQMECEDDDLSISQVDYFRALFNANEIFEKKLEEAKNSKDVRIIYCTGNEIPPILPSKGYATTAKIPTSKQISNTAPNNKNLISNQNSSILQPGLVISGSSPGGMQVIRPGQRQQAIRPASGQPTIMLASSNTANPTTGASTSNVPYKVFVDSRTGIVVGTLPGDGSILQQNIISTAQKMVAPQMIVDTLTTPICKSEINSTSSDSGISESNLTIPEGNKAVTAQSLLSIRAVTPLTVAKEIRKLQKVLLKNHLEKDQFSVEPLKWWLKLGIFDGEMNCRVCFREKVVLVANKLSIDGYSWQCRKGPKCSFAAPVQRINFFSRFGASLAKLHRLIYHWASQSDVLEAIHDSNVDIYMIRAVWRGIQDICTRAVLLKAEKLGGQDRILELSTVKVGRHIIICVMDRKTSLSRMKAVSENSSWALPPVILKTIEPWLFPKSVVMTSEPNLINMSKKDVTYVYVDESYSQRNSNISISKILVYLTDVLGTMFGEFLVSQLKLDTIQGFLDELQWRDRFGKAPKGAFWNIMKDIAEQSGRKVTIPIDPCRPSTVSLLSSCSSGSESDSGTQDALQTIKKAMTAASSRKQKESSPPYKAPGVFNGFKVSSKIVNLHSFYYARKSPNVLIPPLPSNETNNYLFRCFVCHKTIDNNLKVIKHIMAHLESNRQKNPNLSDLTKCKYCFRDFETPYSMQCHIEKVHLASHKHSCKICDLPLTTQRGLINHMASNHVQSEMPYGCGVCQFRSSFHRELIEHFQQSHDGTNQLLCHYCLKVHTIKRFTPPENVGLLQNYYYHLYKHQLKSSNKKCSYCCLVFVTSSDLRAHRSNDHVSMAHNPGTIPITVTNSSESIELVKPLDHENQASADKNQSSKKTFKKLSSRTGLAKYSSPHKKPKALQSNLATSTAHDGPIILTCREALDRSTLTCAECRGIIDYEHFNKKVNCSKCKFITNCLKAFVEHMIGSHSHLTKKRERATSSRPIILPSPMFCPCGFSACNGNRLADHITSCRHKTCYSSLEQAIAAYVKVEPSELESIEQGSAFFPPLVVLDEDEEEFVNQTLSVIPEPKDFIQPEPKKRKLEEITKLLPSSTVVSMISPQRTEEKPNMLNALGLVRRRSDGDSGLDAPPLLIREDVETQFEDRKGPSRNTRMARSAMNAQSNTRALNKEIIDFMAEMELEAPPFLEPQNKL